MAGNGNEKSMANLIPFPKGVSGNPKGRPRKVVSKITDMGYKLSEINDTVQNLLAMTLSELKEVFEHEDATMLEKIIANALYTDLQKGKLNSLETILTRVHGYPTQQITGEIVEQPLFPDVEYPPIDDQEGEEVD